MKQENTTEQPLSLCCQAPQVIKNEYIYCSSCDFECLDFEPETDETEDENEYIEQMATRFGK